MRSRTFILLLLVLVLAAVAIGLFIILSGDVDVAGLVPGLQDPTATPEPAAEGVAAPTPEPTPVANYVQVVVARVDLPVGIRIEEEHINVETRPDDNIAVQAGYTFADSEEVVGRLARTNIRRGQAVLNSMLALSPTDLIDMGSDLGLYVQQGEVAIAMPIDRYSGAAFAMRPGDLVDVLMSVGFVSIDPDFRSALPNTQQLVDETALQEGQEFLFSPMAEGRLELVEEINQVGTIGPRGQLDAEIIPRRVTQLTIQQAEVIWVGTWENPDEVQARAEAAAAEAEADGEPGAAVEQNVITPVRQDIDPNVAIVAMSAQEALALKWAMDRGANIDLALRSQGDGAIFVTTAVSLPQLVEQGGLTIPEPLEFDLAPRADEVPPPAVPD